MRHLQRKLSVKGSGPLLALSIPRGENMLGWARDCKHFHRSPESKTFKLSGPDGAIRLSPCRAKHSQTKPKQYISDELDDT